MLTTKRIYLHPIEHILRFVLPVHLGIRPRNPQLALRNHIRIVLIMTDDIIEGTDGTEEIAFMKLRFAESHPCHAHRRIELFGLQP